MTDDTASIVRALLSAAGIEPPEPEIEAMIQSYPALRAAADGLYTKEISRFDPAFLPTDAETEER